MTNTFSDTLKKYLGEVVAIFIGISISFWFDEWREDRKDREMEQKILKNMKSNLRQDSMILEMTTINVQKMIAGAEKLSQLQLNPSLTDSISYYIDMSASYIGFLANQTTYEEMKQTGHSDLIQDDTLKNFILGYYTSLMPYIQEWCDVDKTHTMTQLIPEMSNYFPVIIDTTNIVPAAEKIKYLQKPKLKHLIITNLAYKREACKALEIAKGNNKRLIGRINKALKK
ncbi:MAG: hypothetical protein J0M29_21915 [Chitinophagales bacterium]|nr:hypothetical protein [Chitinophagales bacterium]